MHIYFCGLGGVAIGPLALIARDAGYRVSGSDQTASRWTSLIAQEGIEVAIGQDGSQIAAAHAAQPIDWLVISAAIPDSHPEVLFAKEQGIKITKRAGLLNLILSDKKLKLIAISGTHGKTTTTAMMVWLFKQCNLPVSYSIGSHMSFGPSGAYQEGSEYFVYEADEFDRNMLEFHPYLSLLTRVGYDHPDIYPSEADYQAAFAQFAAQSGQVVLWQADQAKLEVHHQDLTILDSAAPEIASITLPGLHNRQNAWLVASAFQQLFPHIPIAQILHQLGKFPGTDRRFEKLAPNIYSDYAHHPDEIRATLQLASEVNPKVIVVYQPHQNIRQHEIIDAYQDCFAAASHVYWLPTYLSREDPQLPVLSPTELISHLTEPSIAEPAEMDDALAHTITTAAQDGSLVLCMGAGSIDEWVRAHIATA